MKTWSEKLNCDKKPQIKRIEKSFAGIPAGSLMYISTPLEVDAYVKTISMGKTKAVEHMRNELARKNGADKTCPVSTGIFLRICAEAAYEEYLKDIDSSQITPFWRIVEPNSNLAKKLTCGTEFIEDRVQHEGLIW